jgi:catechol 2,3-dioxygenase-like lactoylglutathione lyase family enzyme
MPGGAGEGERPAVHRCGAGFRNLAPSGGIALEKDDLAGGAAASPSLARLRTHGAELVGEPAQYEDSYRLCYVRGPEGIIVGLAEQLG